MRANRPKSFPVFLAGTLAAAGALAACSDDDSGTESDAGGLDPVVISLTPITDMAPYYLGVDLGFYEEEGLDVEIVTNQGGAAALPQIMTGDVDFGSANPNTIYVAADQGLEPRILLTTSASTGEEGTDAGAVLSFDPAIESAADLAGATVSVPTFNSIGDVTINHAVDEDGGDHTAINYVELPFPDMTSAMESDQVDAAFLVEPFLTNALNNGAHVVTWNYVAMTDDMPITSLYTSQDTIDERGDVVDRFVEATYRSLDYATENPDEVTRILQTYTELSEEQIAQMNLAVWSRDFNHDGYVAIAEQLVELGTVTEMPDVDSLIHRPE